MAGTTLNDRPTSETLRQRPAPAREKVTEEVKYQELSLDPAKVPAEQRGLSAENIFRTQVIEASKQKPILVQVGADWCAPCRDLQQKLPAYLTEHSTKPGLRLMEYNDVKKQLTDSQKTSLGLDNIESFPTVILYKDGKKVDRFCGDQNPAQLEAFLKKNGLQSSASPVATTAPKETASVKPSLIFPVA